MCKKNLTPHLVLFRMLVCPASVPTLCDDGSKCYNSQVICDDNNYCSDGTDEGTSVCGIGNYNVS